MAKDSLVHVRRPPSYLMQSTTDVIEKFRHIQQQEDMRLRDATMNPQDSKWTLGVSVLGHNDHRNRYVNIMPYERNRVKLGVEVGNDYINASFIKVNVPEQSMKPGHYIASQGPTSRTWPQFWHMCYQQCPDDNIVIVMVTPLTENGREKCFPYWPGSREVKLKAPKEQFPGGPEDVSVFSTALEIEFQDSVRESDYTLTTLKLKPSDSSLPTKTVHHFYFDQWRDMSKPDEIIPILNLSRHANELNSNENPIIVHCSAGVGRTGTFITLDHLFHNTVDFDATAQKSPSKYTHDLIEQIVLQLRTQRLKMVQLMDQYLFIYHAAQHVYDSLTRRDM